MVQIVSNNRCMSSVFLHESRVCCPSAQRLHSQSPASREEVQHPSPLDGISDLGKDSLSNPVRCWTDTSA